jgi:hypothetical protein
MEKIEKLKQLLSGAEADVKKFERQMRLERGCERYRIISSACDN